MGNSSELLRQERNCIQAHETSCKLMELHVRPLNFMKVLHSLWDILHAFCNILEHSACILEHSGTLCMHFGHSGTFCMHSETFRNILDDVEGCRKVYFQALTGAQGAKILFMHACIMHMSGLLG